jgi:hypothetical protein
VTDYSPFCSLPLNDSTGCRLFPLLISLYFRGNIFQQETGLYPGKEKMPLVPSQVPSLDILAILHFVICYNCNYFSAFSKRKKGFFRPN